jgi:transposase
MRQLSFSEADLQVLRTERYRHPEPRVLRHLEILWLKSLGYAHDDIAMIAACSRRTVQRTLAVYAQLGLATLLQTTNHAASSALDVYQGSLAERFDKEPPRSVKQARQVIAEQTGIARGLTQVRHFLHRLGLKPRRVAAVPLPPKTTLDEHVQTQANFLEQQLEPRLAEARQGQRQVLFVDAAHFVYASFLGVLWCATRRFVRAASGRQRFNVLAALDAVNHQLLTVCNQSYINALSVGDLLRVVAQAANPRIPITLVMDNARYQKCALVQTLATELGLELLYLPSYSPNLNLIERVWKFVKAECLRMKCYDHYAAFQAAIEQCLAELPTKHHAAMNTLLNHQFQTFENVSFIAA